MTLEEIINEWTVDSKVDDLNVDLEGAKVSKLHSKYVRLLSENRSLLRGYQINRRILERNLREYYLGTASQELLQELGRTPYLQRVLKNEVMLFVEADDSLIKIDIKIAKQQEKVDVLLEIMKSISSRNFSLKLVVDWKRLMVGG